MEKKKTKKRRREKINETQNRKRKTTRRRRHNNNKFRAKDYLRATNMAPAAKKGSKKSFVVDCTRPVRIDCVARIVVASKSDDDDFLFCGEGSPHHRTNVVKIARVSAWSFLEWCEA